MTHLQKADLTCLGIFISIEGSPWPWTWPWTLPKTISLFPKGACSCAFHRGFHTPLASHRPLTTHPFYLPHSQQITLLTTLGKQRPCEGKRPQLLGTRIQTCFMYTFSSVFHVTVVAFFQSWSICLSSGCHSPSVTSPLSPLSLLTLNSLSLKWALKPAHLSPIKNDNNNKPSFNPALPLCCVCKASPFSTRKWLNA